MIQSAVVVPESEEQSQEPSPSLKRRQSSVSSDTSSKRPRLSPLKNGAPGSFTKATSPPSAQRKPSSANTNTGAQERQRSQRLFGNVFSNLNKTSAKPAHRKRDEIEKRAQERLRQQDEEAAEQRRKKREELDALRRKEQKAWDTQCMKTRHENMRATARFLKTKARPHLYYKPWELREEEEEQIKRQIEEVDELIERERAEHDAASRSHGAAEEEVHPPVSKPVPSDTEPDEQKTHANGDGNKELVGANQDENTNKQDSNPTNGNTDNATPTSDTAMRNDRSPPDVPEEKSHDDHGGEELVEGQEDDVIY